MQPVDRFSFSFALTGVMFLVHRETQGDQTGRNEVTVPLDVTKSRGLEPSLEHIALSLPMDFLCLLHE